MPNSTILEGFNIAMTVAGRTSPPLHFSPRMTNSPAAPPSAGPQTKMQPWYAPRIWLGCNLRGWFGLMARNRFDVDLPHMHILAAQIFYCLANAGMAGAQEAAFGRAIRRSRIEKPPLFVLGHWRTGTTLLHELLILDSRHSFPTTYQCLSPNHFLITEKWFTRLFSFLVPDQRPMDNMALGFDKPQEEEFAFINQGMRTPYLTIAFPNRGPQDVEYLDLENVPQPEREKWKRQFYWFLQALNYTAPQQRLVLKSPPHTARIKLLLELFPDAQFVHIVRDPYVVFASTVHLWKSLYRTHGLQTPNFIGLEEYVLATFERMYRRYEADRSLIPAGNLCEIKYEQFVADPQAQLGRVYQELNLGGFDAVQPALEKMLPELKSYKTNRYQLEPHDRESVRRRWGFFFEQYGYDPGA